MAYDERLAQWVDALLPDDVEVEERRMFGGLSFLVDGHMAVAVSRDGGLLVRVDPSSSDDLVASGPATPMVMGGRPMRGWVRVAAEHLATKRQLNRWVGLGTAYARSLPTKPKRSSAPRSR